MWKAKRPDRREWSQALLASEGLPVHNRGMRSRRYRFLAVLSLAGSLVAAAATAATAAAHPIPLRAGSISMVFEPDNAFLRYVKIGDHEILRGINAPVRNELWGTVKPVVSNVALERDGEEAFKLTFDAHCKERNIDFLWKGSLTGTNEGEITFSFDGEARSTFKRNRIGFCVLHGPSAAGQPWIIEHVDGIKETGQFPKFISPHQPAKGIRAITHEVAPDLWAHVVMKGDTFEMEDQRNWTDASFKTYCTPLEIPYPVVVEKGSRISQKVTIELRGDITRIKSTSARDNAPVALTVGKNRAPLPRLGLQVSSEIATLSPKEIGRLRRLHLDHLRVDIIPSDPTFVEKLREAAKQAKALGVKLHIAVRMSDVGEFLPLAEAVISIRPPVAAWFLLGADEALMDVGRKVLEPVSDGALIGAPPDGIGFVDLNRNRPGPNARDIVAYPVTPQIHASDEASIVESLPIQGVTVRSAREFVGDAPLVISPVTFHTLLPGADPLPGELPWDVDPRQPGSFAAGWTVGAIKFLSEAGVYGITFYETVGWKGIMDAAKPPERPKTFPSKPGDVYPVYHVLRDVGAYVGGSVQALESSDELSVIGLLLEREADRRMLIANLKPAERWVKLDGADAKSIFVSPLGARDAAERQSATRPIALPPHAVIRVDFSL